MRCLTALLPVFFLSVISIFSVNAESKTALVIGNGAYQHMPVLLNPVPEALEMKDVLESAGFKVIFLPNGTKADIQEAVRSFNRELQYISARFFC